MVFNPALRIAGPLSLIPELQTHRMNKRKTVKDERISTKLSDLKNPNASEIRSHVIITINQFDNWCALILLRYFEPKKDAEFEFMKVLMNSSIIGFGAKVKLLRSLSIIDEDEFSRLMQLGNIRNAFAHSLHFEVVEKDHKTKDGIVIDRLHHSLEILNSKGEFDIKDMKEWFEEFMEKSDYFLHWLPQILEEFRSSGQIIKVTKKDNYRNRMNS